METLIILSLSNEINRRRSREKYRLSENFEPHVYELGTIQPEVYIFGLHVGSLQGHSFSDDWSRGTLGTRLLAFQWKPPTSLSAGTIYITGDLILSDTQCVFTDQCVI